MSAPSRASRGGQNASKDNASGAMTRGNRGAHSGSHGSKGKAAGGTDGGGAQNAKAEGLLQRLTTGSGPRKGTGRRRPNLRGASSTSTRADLASSHLRASTEPTQKMAKPTSYKEYTDQMQEKYNLLKTRREHERAQAIRQGILADPEKKTTLKDAITPVGTCTNMCAEFERVQRIVQNAVDRTEKVMDEDLGREIASEARMVKRFRRSAAGDDEQLPSDIRTPATLKRSLDYLINDVVGGDEPLATVHKFVWDRTRCIRNDFSIQQVTKPEDVKLAVECFERIARFHILSLHQLSNPDNLAGGNFDAHQEREQMNNTLLSLMYYYDDHRSRQSFKNEAEFRAYCIILEMQATHPDLEHRMQSWPKELLQSIPVRNAFQLHAAASNTLLEQGPLKPSTPFIIAQSNYEGFWQRMRSREVSYLMACLAESHFNQIRYMALQNIWTSNKKAPVAQQKQNDQWNVDELTKALAFDTYEQTIEFCDNVGLAFKEGGKDDLAFLDFTSLNTDKLSPPAGMNRPTFSEDLVEKKRYWRTLPAVINGKSVAEAIKEGLIEEASDVDGSEEEATHVEDGIFVPETQLDVVASTPGSKFDPAAPVFKPSETELPSGFQSATGNTFGQPTSQFSWGQPSNAPTTPPQTSKSSVFSQPTSQVSWGKQGTGASTTPLQPAKSSIFGQPASQSPWGQQEKASSTPLQPSKTSIFGQPTSQTSIGGQINPSTTLSSPPQSSWSGQTTSNASLGGSDNDLGGQASDTTSSTFKPNLSASASSPFSTRFEPSGAASQSVPSIFGQPSEQSKSNIANASTNLNQPPAAPSQSPFATPSNPGTAFNFGSPSINPPAVNHESNPSELPASQPQTDTKPFEQGSQRKTPFSFLSPSNQSQPMTGLPPATSPFSFTGFGAPSGPLSMPSPSTIVADTTQPSLSAPKPFSGFPQEAASMARHETSRNSPPPSSFPSSPKSKPVDGNEVTDTNEDKSSRSATPVSLPAISSSTTSKIPTLFTPPPNTTSRFPRDTRPRNSSPLSQQTDIASQSLVRPQPTPPSVPGVHKAVDKGTIAERVARLAMTEKHGLLQQFVEHRVIKIIQEAMQQFEQEEHDRMFYAARVKYLSKKFGLRWKDNAHKKSLNRRANLRRSRFIETLRQDNLKRQREDDDLQAILEAQKEKAEVQRAQQRESLRYAASLSPAAPTSVPPTQTIAAVAGKKRKSLQADEPENTTVPKERVFANSHKRSRTMDNTVMRSVQAPRSSLAEPTNQNALLSSAFSGRSILLNYPDSPEIQSAARRMKVDRTNTDYFRLKAIGIDPETKSVPHTKGSLEQKQKNEEQEMKRNSLTWSQRRRRAMSTAEHVNPLLAKALRSKATPPTASSAPRSVSAPRPSDASLPQRIEAVKASVPAKAQDDDDEFLRQIREVRNALTQDTQWFKEQAEQIEEEDRRRSDSFEYQSPPSQPSLSPNGASLVNGYEFARSASGMFTRSEQRLRRTGGHGLANRPVAEYLPGGSRYIPAMSKRSAEALRQASLPISEAKHEPSKRTTSQGKRKMIDPTYRYESDHDDDDVPEVSGHHKKKGKTVHQPAAHTNLQDLHVNRSPNDRLIGSMASGLQDQHYQGDILGKGGQEDWEGGSYKGQLPQEQWVGNGDENGDFDEEEHDDEVGLIEDEDAINGQTEGDFYQEEYEDADEEEMEDDDAEEEEDDEEDDEEGPGDLPSLHGYGRLKRVLRSATPEESTDFSSPSRSRSTSQAIGVSGTGASQEDALVLSD